MSLVLGAYELIKDQGDKKKMRDLRRNRPVYNINPEYYENLTTAENAAYGVDPAIVEAEKRLEQANAETISQAQKTTGSGTNVLAVLSAISANKQANVMGLSERQAIIRKDNLQDVYSAKYALAEEKDKAFDYNINAPYQERVAEIRERRKAREERVYGVMNPMATMGASYGFDALAGSTGGVSDGAGG